MIYTSYINRKLAVYFDAKDANAFMERFGTERVNLITQEDLIRVEPHSNGRYHLATVAGVEGARKFSAIGNFNLNPHGRVATKSVELLADGAYIKLPKRLPEPKPMFKRGTKGKTRKSKKAAATPSHTAEDVIAGLEQLPISRERQFLPASAVEGDAQLLVLFEGQQYHLQAQPKDLLSLTLRLLNQNPNS